MSAPPTAKGASTHPLAFASFAFGMHRFGTPFIRSACSPLALCDQQIRVTKPVGPKREAAHMNLEAHASPPEDSASAHCSSRSSRAYSPNDLFNSLEQQPRLLTDINQQDITMNHREST